MKKFQLEISIEGDAFQPAPNYELRDILWKISNGMSLGYFDPPCRVYDRNGNACGSIRIVESLD